MIQRCLISVTAEFCVLTVQLVINVCHVFCVLYRVLSLLPLDRNLANWDQDVWQIVSSFFPFPPSFSFSLSFSVENRLLPRRLDNSAFLHEFVPWGICITIFTQQYTTIHSCAGSAAMISDCCGRLLAHHKTFLMAAFYVMSNTKRGQMYKLFFVLDYFKQLRANKKLFVFIEQTKQQNMHLKCFMSIY